jgi:hypothetical protein
MHRLVQAILQEGMSEQERAEFRMHRVSEQVLGPEHPDLAYPLP